jgi:hypothetical protein
LPIAQEHSIGGRFVSRAAMAASNAGDWFVVVQYADQTAYEKAQTVFAKDPECQQVFVEIAKFAKRISREMVIDLDL